MGVNVDEAGEDGLVAEVDQSGVFRNGRLFTDRRYLIPLDNDDDVTAGPGVLAVDQTTGLKLVNLIRRSKNGQKKETPYDQ